jgi:hypothetical protein
MKEGWSAMADAGKCRCVFVLSLGLLIEGADAFGQIKDGALVATVPLGFKDTDPSRLSSTWSARQYLPSLD